MARERNDFSGPIGDRVPWEEFSTEFLSKIMALWQEQPVCIWRFAFED